MGEPATFQLAELLRAQRGALRVVSAASEESHHYESYSSLVRILTEYGITDAPELNVVDSTHALTEMIEAGSRRWIVYDLHLGRVFTRLHVIVEADATLRSIDADLVRIYTGRLLVHGRNQSAFLIAVFHLNRLMDDLIEAKDTDPQSESTVRAQEVFVLAHELMHFVFAKHPDVASVLTDWYFALCEAEESDVEDRREPTVEDVAEAFAEDINREWVRRQGAIDEALLATGKEKLIAHILAQLKGQERHSSKRARENPALAEEVVCDAGAAVLTAMMLGNSKPEEILNALAAAFDANQKLRLIAHMDAQIVGSELTPKALLDAFTRGSQLRQFYRALYESGYTEIVFGFARTNEDYDTMLERIRIVNERFYRTLFDQLISKTFYTQFARFVDPDTPLKFAVPASVEECWSVAVAAIFKED